MFHDDRRTEPRLTIVEQFALGTPLTDAPLGSLVPRSPSFLFVVFLPSFLLSLSRFSVPKHRIYGKKHAPFNRQTLSPIGEVR